MTVLRLPHVDQDTMRDVVRDLSRDLDMSRLTAIRDDLGHVDLPSADDLRRELGRLDLPSADDLRRELGRLDLPSADDFRRELRRFERDLPDVGKLIGRPRRRAVFVLPTLTPAVVMGAVALLAGAALGGVLAWLYQPNVGVQRRKAVRRRLHRLRRQIQHSR